VAGQWYGITRYRKRSQVMSCIRTKSLPKTAFREREKGKPCHLKMCRKDRVIENVQEGERLDHQTLRFGSRTESYETETVQ
jgi:hypothetical protein